MDAVTHGNARVGVITNAHDYEVALVSSTKFPIEGPFRPRLNPLGPSE